MHTLAEPVSRSQKLQGDISHIQSLIEESLQRKTALQDSIVLHQRLLSPFRCLPDDILQQIFLFCLPQAHNAVMDLHDPPFLLCRVCYRWKSVAYRTPRLWATLHIPLPIHPVQPVVDTHLQFEDYQNTLSVFNDRVIKHCDSIRTWLLRAGTCPLSLSLHPTITYPIQAKTYLKPYLETLVEFSTRWYNLELTVLTGEYSTFFASIPSSAVPILDTLYISFVQHWQDWGQPHDDAWRTSGMIGNPSLRTLYFHHFPFPMSQLNVDWSLMTHLEIPDHRTSWQDRGLTIEEAYVLFNMCQNLRHCAVDVEDTPDAKCSWANLSLRYLETLDILDAAHSLPTLLKVVDFPSLRSVKFHTLFWPSRSRRSPLITLLSNAQSINIVALSMNLQMLTLEDWMEIVQLTPNVQRFASESCRRGPSDEQATWLRGIQDFPIDFITVSLKMLTPDQDELCIWPNLSHVDLGRIRRLFDEDVLEFLKKRMGMAYATDRVVRMKHFKTTFLRDQTEDIRPPLSCYIDVEDGLKLELIYPAVRVAIPGSVRPRKGLFKRNEYFRP